MRTIPKCSCDSPMTPVFNNHGQRRLMAWLCEDCEKWAPPGGTTWEQELDPMVWEKMKIVPINYWRQK